MNEALITFFTAIVTSGMVAVFTFAGQTKRAAIDKKKAGDDFELKLNERTDRLRDSLWADVEEKLNAQDAMIERIKAENAALRGNCATYEKQIAAMAAQLIESREQIATQAAQIKAMKEVIESRENKISEQAAIISKLQGGGHKPATL